MVARELMGKYLVRRVDRIEQAAPITETEAYVGPHDLACHASVGRTPRNEPLFGPPGCWYVYFIYGIHWMLNAVTDEDGYPAAVLIRGVGRWNGPGKLTKALAIDKRFNTLAIDPASELWIEDRGLRIARSRISARRGSVSTTRATGPPSRIASSSSRRYRLKPRLAAGDAERRGD